MFLERRFAPLVLFADMAVARSGVRENEGVVDGGEEMDLEWLFSEPEVGVEDRDRDDLMLWRGSEHGRGGWSRL